MTSAIELTDDGARRKSDPRQTFEDNDTNNANIQVAVHSEISNKRPRFNMEKKYLVLLAYQLIIIIIYFILVKYKSPTAVETTTEAQEAAPAGRVRLMTSDETPGHTYGFEDTHVMIFVGFGFLMTFLKKYSYSAVGFNLLLAALSMQFAVITLGIPHMTENVIVLNKRLLLEADILTATVLITFGALLGVANGMQLIVIAVLEIIFAAGNMYLVTDILKAADIGGSIAIHIFGAYFGLGASLGLRPKKVPEPPGGIGAALGLRPSKSIGPTLNVPGYNSDMFAMIGTLFLWVFWPSFNSALATSLEMNNRAIINTCLTLAASTVTTFAISSMLSKHGGKFDMVHIQNSTLAGGVMCGSVANMFIGPGPAVIMGVLAGVVSVCGYIYITPKLEKWRVLDTCGVHNLHGIPGVLAGLLSVVFCVVASKEDYGNDWTEVFPLIKYDNSKTGTDQCIMQLAATFATVAISFVTGALSGFAVKAKVFKPLKDTEKYNDEVNWVLPAGSQ